MTWLAVSTTGPVCQYQALLLILYSYKLQLLISSDSSDFMGRSIKTATSGYTCSLVMSFDWLHQSRSVLMMHVEPSGLTALGFSA